MSMPAVFVRVSLGHVGDSFEPIETISSSDLTLGILDIPKSRFGCAVESVTAKIKNAEGATMNIPALLKGNVWTATFPRSHFERPGVSTLGVEIAIFGLDENGNVRDWIAGRGDLVVHDSEGGSVIPGEHFQNLHWYDEPPINPERGAVAPIDDVAKVWNGSGWIDLGGGGGGAGATVLTIVGSKVMNGEKEIATYAELLALVQSGGVVLLDTVAGQIAKSALFHPHMADSSAIRFDATGTLGDKVYTRSFAFTPKTGGGIAIARGDLIEVAKSSDIPDVSGFYTKPSTGIPKSDLASGVVPDVVAPASDMDFSSDENKDKVPTCGSVGAALGRHLSLSGGTLTGMLSAPEIETGTLYVSDVFIDFLSSIKLPSGENALSGVTSKDFDDYSRSFGFVCSDDDTGNLIFARRVSPGGYFTPDGKHWYKAERAVLKGEKWNDVSTEMGAVSTYNPSEGFAKLEMLGENIRNNAYWIPDQIKDALFAAGIKDVIGYPAYEKKVYAAGDLVERNGAIYKCKAAITTAEDWTEAHWEKTNVKSQIPDVVAPASDIDLRNKAADAYETGVKLVEKRDYTDLSYMFWKGRRVGPLFFTGDPAVGWKNAEWELNWHRAPLGSDLASWWGLINKELGISLLTVGAEDLRHIEFYSEGFLFEELDLTNGGSIALVSDIATHEAGGLTDSAKAALFADTAFKEAVDKEIDEHGGGGGGEDEATQGVFAAFARMDGYTEADAKDVLDVGIEKMSQLLGENIAA